MSTIIERLEALYADPKGYDALRNDLVRAAPDLLKVVRVAKASVEDTECELPEWGIGHNPTICREATKPREHWCLTCLMADALEPLFREVQP